VFICFARLTHLTIAQKIIYQLLPASECFRVYNILLLRNYKAWLQTFSSAERIQNEGIFGTRTTSFG
jgi:hypothetical protein